jgi:hypothetical protein
MMRINKFKDTYKATKHVLHNQCAWEIRGNQDGLTMISRSFSRLWSRNNPRPRTTTAVSEVK